MAAVQAVVTRAARLAEKGDLVASVLSPAAVVDAALFEKSSEAGMLAVLAQLEPIATGSSPDRYAALARGLSAGAEALAAFFDGDQSVMVMADDPAVAPLPALVDQVLDSKPPPPPPPPPVAEPVKPEPAPAPPPAKGKKGAKGKPK